MLIDTQDNAIYFYFQLTKWQLLIFLCGLQYDCSAVPSVIIKVSAPITIDMNQQGKINCVLESSSWKFKAYGYFIIQTNKGA